MGEKEYWTQRHENYRDSRAVGRTGWNHSKNEASHKQSNEQLGEILRRFVSPRPKVLDLGFGHGHRGWVCGYVQADKYVGIDIAGENKAGPSSPNYLYLKGDITKRNKTIRERGPYEVVMLVDVAYHILGMGRFEKMLHNAKRWVKPGGVVLVSDFFHVPDYTSPHVNRRTMEDYAKVLGAPVEIHRWRDHPLLLAVFRG